MRASKQTGKKTERLTKNRWLRPTAKL